MAMSAANTGPVHCTEAGSNGVQSCKMKGREAENNGVQCIAVQCSAVQCIAVQCSAAPAHRAWLPEGCQDKVGLTCNQLDLITS